MLRVKILCAICVFSMYSYGQVPDLPDSFIMETSDDYAGYEGLCFQLMECLIKSPMEFSNTEFDEASAFCLIWLGGTPNYKVELDTRTAEFIEESPELLYIYMFGLALSEKNFSAKNKTFKESEALNMVASHCDELGTLKDLKSLKRVKRKYKNGSLEKYLTGLKKS